MNTSNQFLVLVLLILTISGLVGYLIMAKAKRYVASKAAITATTCVFLNIIIMRKLLLPYDPILVWSIVGWCVFVFVLVFFAIRGVLAGKHPK